MTPFPSAFPMDAVQILIGHLRHTRVVDAGTLATAGWNVLGYALGQTVGGGEVIDVPIMFDLSDALELAAGVHAAHAGSDTVPGQAIPWGPIAQVILSLLAKWLLG